MASIFIKCYVKITTEEKSEIESAIKYDKSLARKGKYNGINKPIKNSCILGFKAGTSNLIYLLNHASRQSKQCLNQVMLLFPFYSDTKHVS